MKMSKNRSEEKKKAL